MYSINRILVTTDFSDFSIAAMNYAISLAETHDAEIYVLHVVDSSSRKNISRQAKNMKPVESSTEESIRLAMREFIVNAFDEYTEVKQVIRYGHPAEEIALYAKEGQMDLIVMATHGRTGLAHVVIGSIAEKVIRFSSVPVLVVKPTAVLEKLIAEEDIMEELHIKGGEKTNPSKKYIVGKE